MKSKLMIIALLGVSMVALVFLSPMIIPAEEINKSTIAEDICFPPPMPASTCDICARDYDGCGVLPGTIVYGLNGQPANYVLIESVSSVNNIWCYPNRSFLAECCGCE